MNLTVNDHPETVKRIPPAAGGKEVFYPCSDGKPMGETGAHVQTIITLFQILTNHFRRSDDVAVIANMMFYYVEGDPRKVISPDVFVVRNVGPRPAGLQTMGRSSPMLFLKFPRAERGEDLNRKFQLYQQIGVKEYYVFDPEYDYLGDEPLRAFRLIDGVFVKSDVRNGRVFQPGARTRACGYGKTLRLFDRESGEFLKTYDEIDTAMDTMETNLKRIEAENDRLRAELEELKRK
ncbi:MAG: Uma2 family endonuclease [Acidobacteria bacterium]|nr:Uma2 family endonuclease [Acidobacteriota bacterium]